MWLTVGLAVIKVLMALPAVGTFFVSTYQKLQASSQLKKNQETADAMAQAAANSPSNKAELDKVLDKGDL